VFFIFCQAVPDLQTNKKALAALEKRLAKLEAKK